MNDIATHHEIALLAPVPEEHLVSGLVTCSEQGKVAFGSQAWTLFRDLDAARDELAVDAYLYASDSSKFGPPKVRWHGRYVGSVLARAGAHPMGMKYRPKSTEQYRNDNAGHWAVFWEIVDLRELSKNDALPMNHFSGWRTRKN